MPKRAKTVRPVPKNIHLAEDLVVQVELRLYDELEGRVPHGAWQAYITTLILQDLAGGGALLEQSKLVRGKL